MEIGSKRELIIQNIKFRFCKSNGHPCPIHTCSVLRLSASWWENLREHSPDYWLFRPTELDQLYSATFSEISQIQLL